MRRLKQIAVLWLGLAVMMTAVAEENITPAETIDDSVTVETMAADTLPGEPEISELQPEETAIDESLETNEQDAQAATILDGVAHDLSPLGMYQAADWVVKSVMILLVVASVLTWAIWLSKLLQFSGARKRMKQLLTQVLTAYRFDEVEEIADSSTSVGQALIDSVSYELRVSRQEKAWVDEGIKQRIAARLERLQIAEAGSMGFGMGILATVGAVAPFVGLFGTVWGIMNAFIGIAQSQTTNLAVVAPGIAEALLATAMGLVAAIPAVVIYNHFSRSLTAYRALLADVTTGLLILVSRDLDRKSISSQNPQVNLELTRKAEAVSA